LLNQSDYIERLSIDDNAKNFNTLAINLSVLHNSQIKLFSNLYLVKFLNTSAKPFFSCMYVYKNKTKQLTN